MSWSGAQSRKARAKLAPAVRAGLEVSMKFQIIADRMDDLLPAGPEKSVCLRKLLEAKDAAVRAALDLEAGL